MTDEAQTKIEAEGTGAAAPTPAWFIDDGVPGVGDRPAWLNEKFKSVADLGKSYVELEKKFGSAPESYDLSKSKFIDQDYVPFQEFMQLAKDKRVPGEVVDKMVSAIDKYLDEFSVDKEAEIQKLGDNAKERIVTLDNWAKANLSADSYAALEGSLKTAESIKALEEIRGKMMNANPMIPNGNDSGTLNVQTLDDIRAELSANLGKYKTDPAYQKDIAARLERASKNAGFIDKTGS